MVSTKPYLIRAIHEWCTDAGFTPYMAVQVDASTRVPREFVRDGQIVLNVSPDATHQLTMGNEEITFQTRFNGASFPVAVPVAAVVAIYARENGQGMAFEASDTSHAGEAESAGTEMAATELAHPSEAPDVPVRRGSHLTRVK
ncbi:MAG: ClpXP protease specificity-enhancing factor [Rhodocyclaceae bacterium]|jgi:stringent starvation protein B|nr:ClpXP protease specificity-enhancing factor [Rhodocyclaceae bacterium]